MKTASIGRRFAGGVAVIAIASGAAAAPALAGTGQASAVRAVKQQYERVALDEYFGSTSPTRKGGVSFVWDQLTGAGRFAYTRSSACKPGARHHSADRCRAAFDRTFALNQKALRAKATGTAWGAIVATTATRLTFKVAAAGNAVTASDPRNLFRPVKLVKRDGHWLFTSAPPLPR